MNIPNVRSTIFVLLSIAAFILSRVFDTDIFDVLLLIGLYCTFISVRITYFWNIILDLLLLASLIPIEHVNYKLSFYLLISSIVVISLHVGVMIVLYWRGYPVIKTKYDYRNK